jgi:hypothetical protein
LHQQHERDDVQEGRFRGWIIRRVLTIIITDGSCFQVNKKVYPVAMKYDSRFGDAFWNSAKHSFVTYMLRMMTSWAIVCHVYYLPAMERMVGRLYYGCVIGLCMFLFNLGGRGSYRVFQQSEGSDRKTCRPQGHGVGWAVEACSGFASDGCQGSGDVSTLTFAILRIILPNPSLSGTHGGFLASFPSLTPTCVKWQRWTRVLVVSRFACILVIVGSK